MSEARDEREPGLFRPWHYAVLALLALVAIASTAGFLRTNRQFQVTAYLRASPATTPDSPRLANPQWNTTQISLIRSSKVLAAALAQPGVRSLPIVRGESDAVTWLRGRLQPTIPGDGDIIELKLYGAGDREFDYTLILQAVIDAYIAEVANATKAPPAESPGADSAPSGVTIVQPPTVVRR